jgi:hypothetical protein
MIYLCIISTIATLAFIGSFFILAVIAKEQQVQSQIMQSHFEFNCDRLATEEAEEEEFERSFIQDDTTQIEKMTVLDEALKTRRFKNNMKYLKTSQQNEIKPFCHVPVSDKVEAWEFEEDGDPCKACSNDFDINGFDCNHCDIKAQFEIFKNKSAK